MGRNKDERPEAVKAEHERKIATWYFDERKTQTWIAAQLKIDQATVSRTLSKLKNQAAKEALGKTIEWQGDKMLELETLRSELWQAFLASRAEGLNPAYSNEIQKAIALERKVLGLEKSNDMVLALPLEMVALAQELGLDMSKIKDELMRQIRTAYESRHITPGRKASV